MGWFWGSKDDSNASRDATRNLDPSLKEFLKEQTPINPPPREQTPPTPAQPSKPSYRAQLGLDTPGISAEEQNSKPREGQPAVPRESLYQDGRYADLWKTYRSPEELAATTGTDQDRIAAVLETIKDRKAAIARAALENCVEEQVEERDCYRYGAWTDRIMMCQTQRRAFNRCYTMQSRFLRALGYLSDYHATPEEEEKIQMHADKLYHEMLEREKEMDEARAAGKEVPSQANAVIPSERTTQALGEESAWARARRKAADDGAPAKLADFSPEKQASIKERLRGMNDSQREVELQLIAAESRAMREYTVQIEAEFREEKKRREERRAKGTDTVGDKLKTWAGYGNQR